MIPRLPWLLVPGRNQLKNSKVTLYLRRPRKVFLSPALVWLEQEGLPSARREARVIAEALGVKVEEEEVVRMAMDTWKKMTVEEKALWRKKAKEAEDYNKRM